MSRGDGPHGGGRRCVRVAFLIRVRNGHKGFVRGEGGEHCCEALLRLRVLYMIVIYNLPATYRLREPHCSILESLRTWPRQALWVGR